DDIAHALGIARRTLVSRLASAGLPGPAALITWSRLLVVAHLLEDPARSVDQVAAAVGFPSSTSLRVTCKRYTGVRPLDLRSRGGHRHVLDLIRAEVGMEQRAIGLRAALRASLGGPRHARWSRGRCGSIVRHSVRDLSGLLHRRGEALDVERA